jgi:hypothetical protein
MPTIKSIRICIVLMLAVATVEGQVIYPRVGLTGANNSMRSTNSEVSAATAFVAGAGYGHYLTPDFSIQFEVNYVQKAFVEKSSAVFSQTIDTDTYFVEEHNVHHYRISYLEIPVLLKYSLIPKKFFLLAGPSVAYGLGGSTRWEYSRTSSYFDPVSTDIKGKIRFADKPSSDSENAYFHNRWDMNVQVGFGVLLAKTLFLDVRYGVGLTNLYKEANSKTNTFQLAVSVPIKIAP